MSHAPTTIMPRIRTWCTCSFMISSFLSIDKELPINCFVKYNTVLYHMKHYGSLVASHWLAITGPAALEFKVARATRADAD